MLQLHNYFNYYNINILHKETQTMFCRFYPWNFILLKFILLR